MKYWNCILRTILINVTFCQKQIQEQWQRRDKKRITTISVSICSSSISLNGMFGECKTIIHQLPYLCFSSRPASQQANQIELRLQTQPTIKLSFLKLISVSELLSFKILRILQLIYCHIISCNYFFTVAHLMFSLRIECKKGGRL